MTNKVLGFLGVLLNRRDWVYLLSLLVPFIVYNLALKAASVISQPGGHGLAPTLDLMRSDVFFNLGYALFWIGLFAMARRGILRWVVVVLFHVVTMLVVIVSTCAHEYLRESGTTLDYGTIAEWIPKFREIVPILVHDVPLTAWMLLFAALFYATLGPWLVVHAVEWWRGWPGRSPAESPRISFSGPLGLFLLALGFGALSPMVSFGSADTSLARDQFVNVVLTGVEEATAEENYSNADPSVDPMPAYASLVETSQTQKRNVVLIHLESTRARSVTLTTRTWRRRLSSTS